MGGAVGGRAPELGTRVALELGLADPVIGWSATRVRTAELASALGVLAGVFGKVARDVTLLAQDEIGEVSESGGGGGSSSMAHKHNPVAAVSTLACTRRVPGLVATVLAGMETEHERAARAWQAEWGTLADLLTLTGSAASWTGTLVHGLHIHTDRMAENLRAAVTGDQPPPAGIDELIDRGWRRTSPLRCRREVSRPSARPPRHLGRRARGRVCPTPAGRAGRDLSERRGQAPPRARRIDRRTGAAARRLTRDDARDVGTAARGPRADAQLVRFDIRGHGRSPVPAGPYRIDDLGSDVLRLMDDLQLERASYCGLSIGGMVGQWLAINAPERLDRLILICTGAFLPPADPWLERAAAVRAAGTPDVIADAVVARWFTEPFAAEHPDTVARYHAMIGATDPGGYAACCEAIAAMDLRAGLPSVTTPTLVLSGAQDPAIPPSTAG